MKIVIYTLFVLIALVGCSVSGLESTKPVANLRTEKSPKDYADCLSGSWLEKFDAVSNTIKTPKGYKVIVSGGLGDIIYMGTIEEFEKGANVKIYHKPIMFNYGVEDVVNAARSCSL